MGSKTKLRCNCNLHGDWETTIISSFKRGNSCPNCKAVDLAKRTLLDESVLIERFKASGYFLPGTQFFKGKTNSEWFYYCPVCAKDHYAVIGLCNGVFRTTRDKLTQGVLSCRCSKTYRWTDAQWLYRIENKLNELGYQLISVDVPTKSRSRLNYLCPLHGEKYLTVNDLFSGRCCNECAGQHQRLFYINVVYDKKTILGIKFGITINLHRRLLEQNRHNQLKMQRIITALFMSVDDCKRAEKACKERLDCGIVDENKMVDGWTETTNVGNLLTILKIIKEHKGELI